MNAPASTERIRAIDWLRGLAVLVMIQCHAMVLLRPELQSSLTARWLAVIDGVVAPAFLFSAGFALALLMVRSAASGKLRARLGRNLRRTLEVLGVASLVNWMWYPLLREPRWLLRIDILQCVGLSLLLALPVAAGLASRPRVLRATALVLGLVIFGLAPLGESLEGPWAQALNTTTGSVFPLLPWMGYVWLGVYAGAVAAQRGLGGLARALLFLGVLGFVGMCCARPLLALYPWHQFYVTNPSNAADRWMWTCIVLLLLVGLERWLPSERRPSWARRFVETFGGSSLSAYFFHQGLLYFHVFGLCFEVLWGRRCGWGQYALLTVLLLVMTYGLCLGLDRVQEALRRGTRLLGEALREGLGTKFVRLR